MFYFCFISRPRTCKTNGWNNTETFFTDSAPLGKVGLLKPTSLLACLDLFLASVNYARKKASDSVFDSLFQKVSVTAEDLDFDISILTHVGLYTVNKYIASTFWLHPIAQLSTYYKQASF